MAHQENEISWQVLRRIVHEWAGTSAELAEVKPLVGGSISNTLCLTTAGGERAVLKISPHRVNRDVQRKAHPSGVLGSRGLPGPRVLLAHMATLENPDSYLLLEHVEGTDLGTARLQCSPEQYDELQRELAEHVLTLHRQTGPAYSRDFGDDATPRFARWTE